MKPETRVLVSKCYGSVCLAIILRGAEIDGAASGRSCEDLCEDVDRRGYMGELRFYAGDCPCGLRPIPEKRLEVESILLALSASLPLWLEKTRRLLEEDP